MTVTTSVKTVDRLVRVLDCFTAERPTWSLAELSEALDLPKSTLHRFLTSLEQHAILRRDPRDKLWRLGYRLMSWGNLAAQSTSLRDIARPIMSELVAATGETVILTVYDHHTVVCVEKVETNHSVRMTLDVGSRRRPHAGASSKILMAYLPEREIRAIIDEGLTRVSRNTVTDPEALRAELAQIREQGYAESLEETDPGAWGVATPIWNDHEVIAAIGIAGPSSRFSDELAQSYVALCKDAVHRVSALLRSK